MKTLKILIALSIMLGFATSAVDAQAQQGSTTWYQCYNLPCVGEVVCGDMTYSWFQNGKINKFELSGTFIGQSTGTVYKFKETWDDKHFGHEANDGNVNYHHETIMLHANGKLVAILHGIGHNTVNANGENVNDMWKGYELECK
jgi:hypothetical protein